MPAAYCLTSVPTVTCGQWMPLKSSITSWVYCSWCLSGCPPVPAIVSIQKVDFTTDALEPLLQGTLQPTQEAILSTRDTLLRGVVFPPGVIDEVTAFMTALTDPAARDLSHITPAGVPSGLPVDRP